MRHDLMPFNAELVLVKTGILGGTILITVTPICKVLLAKGVVGVPTDTTRLSTKHCSCIGMLAPNWSLQSASEGTVDSVCQQSQTIM